MSLKIPSFLVSVDWLLKNLENESLLILDATIPKVGSKTTEIVQEKSQLMLLKQAQKDFTSLVAFITAQGQQKKKYPN